ncbi:aminotransferase class V-fold PLP-dependent enzyme [Alteribacter aurantiacus]|uniref:aminotransferase class V-fold PLP-dependent enzyme n=1 Tax=Alteribacter aurantiacus TaxID=254410 RepID=UPI00042462ED|nr:aminotransferase class V-fold PLP-dependent enzyme [Alteribacter aurantiacus]
MIYLDNAASSFPKPDEVAKAVAEAVTQYGANPGRSGHQLSRRAASVVEQCRKELSHFFNGYGSERVLFYQNATVALNQAILGFPFKKGDHVVATVFEHNSVRRPLEWLVEERGIDVTYITPSKQGWTKDCLVKELKPETKMVVATHASNVTGDMIPLSEWGEVLRERVGTVFAVDASQTAGVVPVSMKGEKIDLLAFPGHKGLLGPQGVGVLMVASDIQLQPIHFGGTGSYSSDRFQPAVWPNGMESGTLNTPGIAGLLKGLEWVRNCGIETVFEHDQKLGKALSQGLRSIEGVKVYSSRGDGIGVVSFVIEGVDAHETAMILDEHYGIAVRSGLHCAPLMHKYLKTEESGLVRASIGPFTTEEHLDALVTAVREIKEGLLG